VTVQFEVVNHKVINKDGWSLLLPRKVIKGLVNFGEPDVYTQSSTQLYPFGTKLEYADDKVFRYGKIKTTSTNAPLARLCGNACVAPGATGGGSYGYEGTLDATSNYAVGSTTLIMNDTTDRAENVYEDGRLAVYPATQYALYRIAGNEAAATVDDVTIYLDTPLKVALVVSSTSITAYYSKWSNVVQEGASSTGYMSAIGMRIGASMTAGYFSWFQTRGQVIIGGGGGGSSGYRTATYNWNDGYGADAASYDPTSGFQMIGYWVYSTYSSYGDLVVQLMLE